MLRRFAVVLVAAFFVGALGTAVSDAEVRPPTIRSACRTLWSEARHSTIRGADDDIKRVARLSTRLAKSIHEVPFRDSLLAVADTARSRRWLTRGEFEASGPVLQVGRTCLAAFGKETLDTGPWWGDWPGITNLRAPPDCVSATWGCGG